MISLVVCTVGPIENLDKFLRIASTYVFDNFEIIICDQNVDDRVSLLLSSVNFKPKNYTIKHLRTPLGLSKSRNIGLKESQYDIVAVPDDDCFYDDNTLRNVYDYFNIHKNIDILLCKWLNPEINGYQPHKTFKSQEIKKVSKIFSMMSSQIFFRKSILNEIGYFDEKLGLGADSFFQGSEDYDFLLRAINYGKKIFYSSDIIIYHPWKGIEMKKSELEVKQHFDRIMKAGASDYYVFLKNLSLLYRIRFILGNLFYLIIFLFYNKSFFLSYYHRIKGFIYTIWQFKRI